jgi:hypothetical protein
MFSLHSHLTRKAYPRTSIAAHGATPPPSEPRATHANTSHHISAPSHRTLGSGAPGRVATQAHANAAQQHLDLGKLLLNGLACMLGQGAVFGSTFAAVNFLRLTGNPAVRVAAGGLIAGGAAATALADQAARSLLDCKPTPLDKPSLATDSIASLALLFVNLFYLRAPFLPKFAANTLQGAAATSALTMAGCGLAGAANELAAQRARAATPAGRGSPAAPDLTRVAWGRFLSVIPMSLCNQLPAAFITHAGRVPAWVVPLPIMVGTAGWTLRRVLMPPETGVRTDAPAAPALSRRLAQRVENSYHGMPPCEKGPK